MNLLPDRKRVFAMTWDKAARSPFGASIVTCEGSAHNPCKFVTTQVGVSCGCQPAVARFQPGEVKGPRLSRFCPELEAGVRLGHLSRADARSLP